MKALEDWQNGDITDTEALRALASDLGEVEDSLSPLEAERKTLRTALETITTRLGGKASVPGFGSLAVTAGGETVSYDARAADALMARLLSDGYPHYAEMLAAARKTGTRAGSLRIVREKAGKL